MHFSGISLWTKQKAYKVYDLAARKAFISRDVLFFEQCFPFLQQHNGSPLPLPLPICDNTEDFPAGFDHDNMSSHTPTSVLPHNLPDNPSVIQSSDSSQPTAEAHPQNQSVSLPSS